MEGKRGSADEAAGAKQPEPGDAGRQTALENGCGRTSGDAAPKRARKRWPVAVGAVAVVLLAAGAGFWVWHEQPSFCNAVCHEPMDAYVEGYYNDPAQMAYTHQVVGETCLGCHEPKLDEQLTEAAAWVSGDYAMGDDGMLATVGVRADAAMCTGSGCHDMAEVAGATQNWGGEEGANPHDSHQGYALDCSSCHTAHGQSIMYCNTCHDFEVPQGWAEPASSTAASAR